MFPASVKIILSWCDTERINKFPCFGPKFGHLQPVSVINTDIRIYVSGDIAEKRLHTTNYIPQVNKLVSVQISCARSQSGYVTRDDSQRCNVGTML